MAYEGFLSLSAENDAPLVGPMFIESDSACITATGESLLSQGVAVFLVDCSKQDEAKVYITQLSPESLQALLEDPDLIKTTVSLLQDTTQLLGEVSPYDSMTRFPFKSEQGTQELVLRHLERPIEPLQVGRLVIGATSMN